MPPTRHALLSASSAHRWMLCTPSARACEGLEEHTSPYARQGTDAHALCEYKLKKALGMETEDPTEHLSYFDAEMDGYSDDYCAFVLAQLAAVQEGCDAQLLIEQQLDFCCWVPEGFGTGDAVIVSDHTLHIIDFKYGRGILIEVENNPQLRCYALGALAGYDGTRNISTIKMSIFQPRMRNVGTAQMKKSDLLFWAEGVLTPAAQLAYTGEGEYMAGDHCRFCRLKATCRAWAEYNLELARTDFSGK